MKDFVKKYEIMWDAKFAFLLSITSNGKTGIFSNGMTRVAKHKNGKIHGRIIKGIGIELKINAPIRAGFTFQNKDYGQTIEYGFTN